MSVGLSGTLVHGRGSLVRRGGSRLGVGGWSGLPHDWHGAVDTTPAWVTHAGVDIGAFLTNKIL